MLTGIGIYQESLYPGLNNTMHSFGKRNRRMQRLRRLMAGFKNKILFFRQPAAPLEDRTEKIIFLHIPKTAGTSFRQIVKKEFPRGQCLFIYTHTPEFFSSIKDDLPAAKAIYGHVSFGIHNILGIRGRYVTFLRDPVRRVLSFYNHQARKRDSEFYRQIKAGLTLRRMLQSGICHQLNNHMVRIISGYESVEPVDDTAVFNRAVSNIDRSFELVGLVERLPESVALLGRKLGFRKQHRIPRRNVNLRPRSRNIDDATLADIRQYNRLDLMLYQHVQRRFETALKMAGF